LVAFTSWGHGAPWTVTPVVTGQPIRACTTCLTWEQRPWAALQGTVATSSYPSLLVYGHSSVEVPCKA
jgi:hypothetical protein